jgi:hypothetical protein
MRTQAWLCFGCRIAVRRPTGYSQPVPCSTCGIDCVYLGDRIPVPPNDKPKDWVSLQAQLIREQERHRLAVEADRLQSKQKLEQEIDRLSLLQTNRGRATAIKLLQKKLKSLDK